MEAEKNTDTTWRGLVTENSEKMKAYDWVVLAFLLCVLSCILSQEMTDIAICRISQEALIAREQEQSGPRQSFQDVLHMRIAGCIAFLRRFVMIPYFITTVGQKDRVLALIGTLMEALFEDF